MSTIIHGERDMVLENKIPKKYRAIDLFAGIGGIRLGFQQAFGDSIIFNFSNEIDDYSCETYEANFGENPKGDITKLVPKEIPDFDILLAGFPCQAFSIAGHKRGFDDIRGTLFFYVADILRVKQPVAFLLENVKHLLSHDKGRTIQVIKDVLKKDLGYNIHVSVLNAKDFGVPQNRERVFIVGFKENLKFEFPKPLKIDVKLEDILEKEVDDSFYLSHEYLTGLKRHRARHEAKGNGFGYEVRDRNGIANTIVCGGMGKERNLVYDKILPNCWKQEGDDIQLRNEEGIRKMTPREWARLQGFPDSFIFPVSKTRKYRQLGNSVAVPVIKVIAEQMFKTLQKSELDESLPALDPEIDQMYDFLIKMFEKKNFTATGKKNISSLRRFISQNYIRINDFASLLHNLENFGFLEQSNAKYIKFPSFLHNDYKECEFNELLNEKINNSSTSSIRQKYLDEGIITAKSN